ncbi:MAG: SulP family inorganic anion transporter [Planctomycetota bacterium]
MLNFFRSNTANAKDDLLSGLTVALALVPEAIAFAFVAGVSPLIGLYSAFFIGLITSIFGGRPGMISGATGAMAVIVVALVQLHGIEYLFPAVILCGLIQIATGFGRLGKLIRMVPHSVMLGFVNGLAIVIGLAQLGSFRTIDSVSDELVYLSGRPLAIMLTLVAVTMAIIWLLPKVTRAVPASLVAILSVTLLSLGINQVYSGTDNNLVPTVGDMLQTNARAAELQRSRERLADHGVESGMTIANGQSVQLVGHATDVPVAPRDHESDVVPPTDSETTKEAGISGGLPVPFFMQHALPPISWDTLWIIFPFSLTLAAVGLIESLMTMTLIDEITDTRGRGNKECVGQGAANVLCGMFGGMGGCAMIGQSLINVNSGGRGRLSGITAAISLLLFILFCAPVIERIPMAALVGVMFMVVIGTFEWASLKMIRRVPKADVIVMVLVAGYTVIMHDLAKAVILGVIVSAVVFAWQHATHIGAQSHFNEFGSKIYQLHGPLFFASASSFKELFDVQLDPDDVVIDFYYTRVYDQSGLEAINALAERYDAAGKRLHLTHLSAECRQLLDKAGDLVEVNVSRDPQYHLATDRLG